MLNAFVFGSFSSFSLCWCSFFTTSLAFRSLKVIGEDFALIQRLITCPQPETPASVLPHLLNYTTCGSILCGSMKFVCSARNKRFSTVNSELSRFYIARPWKQRPS